MIRIPVALKTLVPGYRTRWLAGHATMLREITALDGRLTYGGSDEEPWIELREGPRLFGHATSPAVGEIYDILRPALPARLARPHFQLVRSCVNLHLYPHMRPDLKPPGPASELEGFQATHRDAIADVADPALRATLADAFRPKPDDIIVDCGSFLGFGELALAPLLPRGRLLAVEAKAANYRLLARNLEWNNCRNVTPLHRAVWSHDTEIDLHTDHAHANTLVPEVHRGAGTEHVKAACIDSLVAEQALPKVDMLSLTLNGAEVEALSGAVETLRRWRPRIRLAGWYQRQGRRIADICREQLEPYGYRVVIGHRGNLLAIASA